MYERCRDLQSSRASILRRWTSRLLAASDTIEQELLLPDITALNEQIKNACCYELFYWQMSRVC